MLTELLQLFDQDQSIHRGSFTFTGRDGQVLKQIFDAIVRIEHNLLDSQPVDDTTVPAASALTGTARGLASQPAILNGKTSNEDLWFNCISSFK